MARKRRPPVTHLEVEAILWADAQVCTRETLDDVLPENLTVGFVLKETAKVILLAHEISPIEEDDESNVQYDFTKIPVSLVIKRYKIGTYTHELPPAIVEPVK
jgi:hypothetical protein